ncbi:MAG: hypothetical protein ACOYXT_10245 [Bacteroidota bacterium]
MPSNTGGSENPGLAASYLHNGAFVTLAEVIDFYNRGGGRAGHWTYPIKTLPADNLHLTSLEKPSMIPLSIG